MSALRSIGPRVAAAAGVVLACAAQAGPVTIGFEGQAPAAGAASVPSPYVESGYALSYAGSPDTALFYGADFIGTNPAYISNGSVVFGLCGLAGVGCSANVVTLTRATPFSLLGLDLSTLFREGARGAASVQDAPGDTLDLVGTFGDGSTIAQSLNVTTAWTPATLAGFVNLTSVALTGSGSFVGIDNLRLDDGQTGTVPEPLTLGLAGMALAALHHAPPPARGMSRA